LVDLETIVKKLNKAGKSTSFGAGSPRRASHPEAAGLPTLFNFFTMVSRSTKPDTFTFPCPASMLLRYTTEDECKRTLSFKGEKMAANTRTKIKIEYLHYRL
jgi:hypothetical protein